MNEITALQLRDGAKNQLAQIKDIETGTAYLNKVKAIEVWAKAEKKDAELQNIIAEQKIRTQRILGQLLIENKKELLSRSPESSDLDDYSISQNDSSTFQKIARLPEEKFEETIKAARQESEDRVELTTTRVKRAAEEYQRSVNGNKIITVEIPDGVTDGSSILSHLEILADEIKHFKNDIKTIANVMDEEDKEKLKNYWYIVKDFNEELISKF